MILSRRGVCDREACHYYGITADHCKTPCGVTEQAAALAASLVHALRKPGGKNSGDGIQTMRRTAIFLLGALMATAGHASVEVGIFAYNAGDHAAAFKEFSAAAESGDPAGIHLLASLYYQGHGVDKDLSKAVELFLKAADAGYPPSLANLALMYSSGDGVPQDMSKAIEFGRKAAEAGDLQSQFNLAQAYRKGAGVTQDLALAARWYKQAAEAGYAPAQNEYGLLFAQGQGVPLDYIQAYAWIDMPANAGNEWALKNRAQLLQILTPQQQEKARALAKEYAQQYGASSR